MEEDFTSRENQICKRSPRGRKSTLVSWRDSERNERWICQPSDEGTLRTQAAFDAMEQSAKWISCRYGLWTACKWFYSVCADDPGLLLLSVLYMKDTLLFLVCDNVIDDFMSQIKHCFGVLNFDGYREDFWMHSGVLWGLHKTLKCSNGGEDVEIL